MASSSCVRFYWYPFWRFWFSASQSLLNHVTLVRSVCCLLFQRDVTLSRLCTESDTDFNGGLPDSTESSCSNAGIPASTREECCQLCYDCSVCFKAVWFGNYCYLKGSAATSLYLSGRTACFTNRTTPCPAGKFDVDDICTNCTRGMYLNDPRRVPNTCISCRSGQFAPNATSVTCSGSLCGAGSYGPVGSISAEAASCSVCPAGYRSDSAGLESCVLCGAGRYSSANSSTCVSSGASCGAGKYGKSGATTESEATCANCSAGMHQAHTGISYCTSCSSGKYAAFGGARECAVGLSGGECAAGRYGVVGASSSAETSCSNCTSGRYQDVAGLGACKVCGAGFYTSLPGQSQCEKAAGCSKGRYGVSDAVSGATECTDCAAGRYQGMEGGASCLACEPGRYASSVAQSSCVLVRSCVAGEQGPAGAVSASEAVCEACGAGMFSALAGSTSCTACPSGEWVSK